VLDVPVGEVQSTVTGGGRWAPRGGTSRGGPGDRAAAGPGGRRHRGTGRMACAGRRSPGGWRGAGHL